MFLPRDNRTYKMPIHFGGQGADPSLTGKCTYHDVTAIRINYETDAAQLENYLPSGFALLQPTLCLSYASCKAIDWMGGGDYTYRCPSSTPATHRA